MKKQFNRMRQLANQTVGRAEKTEVLSDDLLQVEKRLDLVKQVTHSTHKKLTACLQGQQGAEEREKKSKKLPLTILAQCMVEGAAVLGDDSLLGKMLNLCGETEEKLAQELIQFEFQIEKDVVEPLYELAEVDIPNIQKQRKHLAKLVLDMDSARTRFHQSSKSSSHPSNLQAGGAKGEALREEMEEAANRMEICRDQLSADMYNFVAKEIDYANYFQTLIEIQAEYHRKSLEILQSVLPTIKAHQEAWVEKPSYGKALEEHLTISSREIAFPIEACVTMLLECGMQEEGLFRVAPSTSKLKKLKASLDCGVMDVQEFSADPHAIAGALKSYLRELPEPLMTSELYEDWIQASKYLIKFLAKLGDYQDSNKMTPGNMAIVLGPNLLWTHSNESGNMTEMMTTVSLQIVGIIEPIIQHADWFFPGDIEFNLTGCYGSPVHTNHNSNYSSMPSPDMDQSERKLPHDHGRRPLSVATDNMMLEFYKKDGIRKIQSMGVRVMDTSWVSRKGSSTLARKASSTPPSVQGPGSPADHSLILEQPGELLQLQLFLLCSVLYIPTAQTTCRPIVRTPLMSTLPLGQGRSGRPLPTPPPPYPTPPPTTSTPTPRSYPVLAPWPQGQSSKKPAPIPPKVPAGYGQSGSGGISDQSTGQPSPVSLSPTPPSTPSPYGLAGPPQAPGGLGASSPGQTPLCGSLGSLGSLSSPPSLTGTLGKSRPTPKPRQRPSLPPPQPPTVPQPGATPVGPGPLEQGILDGLSPGESMSTGKQLHHSGLELHYRLHYSGLELHYRLHYSGLELHYR
uniref:Rho GTPase activating protein 44 n=1 Tax=Oncorhynchus mykiss TaxID=8022 RepID=A0A8K9WU14_ONCMY